MQDRQLTPATREALILPAAERIRYIKLHKMFVRHRKIAEIRGALDDARARFPLDGDKHILVWGDPGMGKTEFGKDYTARALANEDPEAEASLIQVIYVPMPSPLRAGALAKAIIKTLGGQLAKRSSEEDAILDAEALMEAVGLQMLIIDDLHHMNRARNQAQRDIVLDMLKNWGSTLRICIVALGTDDAKRALRSDPQTRRRFTMLELAKWELDNNVSGFLASLESVLPLANASNLNAPSMAAFILDRSEGITSYAVELVRSAAVLAVGSKEEAITLPLLRAMPWQRPSERGEDES